MTEPVSFRAADGSPIKMRAWLPRMGVLIDPYVDWSQAPVEASAWGVTSDGEAVWLSLDSISVTKITDQPFAGEIYGVIGPAPGLLLP